MNFDDLLEDQDPQSAMAAQGLQQLGSTAGQYLKGEFEQGQEQGQQFLKGSHLLGQNIPGETREEQLARWKQAGQLMEPSLMSTVMGTLGAPSGPGNIGRAATHELSALGELPKTEFVGKKSLEPHAPLPELSDWEKQILSREPNLVEPRNGTYSKLQKLIQDKMGNSATPEQVVAIAKEAKPEEVNYTGLNDFLKDKSKVSKKDVLKHLQENELTIYHNLKEPFDEELINDKNLLNFKEDIGFEEPIKELRKLVKHVEIYNKKFSDFVTGHEPPQYEKYTLPGGKEYQEHVFSWDAPLKKGIGPDFESSHWSGIENVIAHARTNERVDTEGKKLFHIEEVQSDLHQEGREHGYYKEPQNFPKGTTIKSDPGYPDKYRAYDANNKVITNSNGTDLWGKSPRDLEYKYKDGQPQSEIPDAPLKKSWHEYVLKKMLYEAANRDADRLSWTPGELQAERWGSYKRDPKTNIWVYENNKPVPFPGMVNFYDKQIPQFLEKVGKKFGAKLGETTIESGHKVPYLELTPALKKSILEEGLPDVAQGGLVQHFDNGGTVQPDQPVLSFDELPDDSAMAQGPGQTLKAGAEAVGRGLAGPLFTAAERLAGVSPAMIEARQREHPYVSTAGEIAGFAGPALATWGASALGQAGAAGTLAAASRFTQAGALETLASRFVPEGMGKIGSLAVKGAIENAAYQAGDEVSKQILHPEFTQDAFTSALANMATSGVIGAVLSPPIEIGLGKVLGQKTAADLIAHNENKTLLHAMQRKANGIEGLASDSFKDAQNLLGTNISIFGEGAASANPEIKNMVSITSQAPNAPGAEVSMALAKDRDAIQQDIIRVAGGNPADLPDTWSQYEAGKQPVTTIAEKLKENFGPIEKGYKQIKDQYSKIGLNQSPEVLTTLGDQLGHLVIDQNWQGAEDALKLVHFAQNRLPKMETIGNLEDLMKQVSNAAQKDKSFYASSKINNIIREGQFEALSQAIGKDGGEAAQALFNDTRSAFRAHAQTVDALNEHFKLTDYTPTGYADRLIEEATEHGANFWNKLANTKNVQFLNYLNQNFPEAAAQIKKQFVDKMLTEAAVKGEKKGFIDASVIMDKISQLNKTSPEFKNFIFTPEQIQKIQAGQVMLNHLKDGNFNFSNTARVSKQMLEPIVGGAMALATALSTHNPTSALLVAAASRVNGVAPDYARVALLKFLASDKEIDSTAFGKMIKIAANIGKGNAAIESGIKNVFKAGNAVIPAEYFRQTDEYSKLSKQAEQLAQNTAPFFQAEPDIAHYMPNLSQMMLNHAANSARYLASTKNPSVKQNPLDRPVPPTMQQQMEHQRALLIAEHPLFILDQIRNGTLLPSDVKHMQSLHPELYQRLVKQLSIQMNNELTLGTPIPYARRQSLSLFFGQPLDATFTPQGLQSIQSTFSGPTGPAPEQQMKPQRKGSTSALNKLPHSLMTGVQARESRANKI